MTRRKLAQRDIMQSYIENEQKEFVPPAPQFVPVEKKTEKSAIIKPETKRAKKEDALRKNSEIPEQEGDTNGLKAKGIQK